MSENKRFTHKKWLDERQIFDNEEAIAIVDSYAQAEILCNKLNEFANENEQLIKENELLKIALCYALDDMGSSYHVDLFENIFDFNFYELIGRACDIEWEDLLKEDGEND